MQTWQTGSSQLCKCHERREPRQGVVRLTHKNVMAGAQSHPPGPRHWRSKFTEQEPQKDGGQRAAPSPEKRPPQKSLNPSFSLPLLGTTGPRGSYH